MTAKDYIREWNSMKREETIQAIESMTNPYSIEDCIDGCEGLEGGYEIILDVISRLDPSSIDPRVVEEETGIDLETILCEMGFDDDLLEAFKDEL